MRNLDQASKRFLTLFFACLLCGIAQAQDYHNPEKSDAHKHESEFKHWRLGALLCHTYIQTETSEGVKTVALPSVGIDIEYWFNERWGIGSHNDIELEVLEVKSPSGEQEFVNRSYPLVVTIDALWKPFGNLVYVAGAGVEIEQSRSFSVLRGGLEYEIEFGNHWDVAPSICYDCRIGAFDTWTYGLGIGKRF